MATATMEATIQALERAGWRLQNLSTVGRSELWSCILERRKLGRDGHAVYASSPLSGTPGEALDAAWEAARAKGNDPQPRPVRVPHIDRLKVAMIAANTALTTTEIPDADDDSF